MQNDSGLKEQFVHKLSLFNIFGTLFDSVIIYSALYCYKNPYFFLLWRQFE